MRKRAVKRNIKKTFFLVSLILIVLVLVVLSFLIIKSLYPIFNAANNPSSKTIIKPLVDPVSIDSLEKRLSDKNIIFEKLENASDSSSIVGKIKDGPEVFFSKSQDLDWEINSLVLIISRLAIDSKKPVFIDLRSLKPIVKF